MKRYWLETYGCQMNKAESGSLELELRHRGWEAAESLSEADLVILNTCSVRQTAEQRIWGRLGFFKAEKRRAAQQGRRFRLVLMGCMGQRLEEELLEQAPQIDVLAGTFQKHRLLEVLEREPASEGRGALSLTGLEEYRFFAGHNADGFRALVPIMHGCDNFCTYCIVPHVRGPEISRSPDSIMAELDALQAGSPTVREITLLGQNVNSYRHRGDEGTVLDFPGLLRRILGRFNSPVWLRFLTSHPKDVSEALIALLAEGGALCPHLHLPVQHGSNRILAAMGRGYTAERYLELVARARKAVPGLSLTTDILIGFPGEGEEDFRRTVELMEEVQFDDAFTYRYNPREGTPAFALGDDVPDAVKQERLAQIIRLQRRITRSRKLARLGSVVEVLVESRSRKDPQELLGRTASDETVVFAGPEDRIGGFCRVLLRELRGGTFAGAEQGAG
jgi:tRNA-2-methylthio-N6-dimethylallyladenosine synthase